MKKDWKKWRVDDVYQIIFLNEERIVTRSKKTKRKKYCGHKTMEACGHKAIEAANIEDEEERHRENVNKDKCFEATASAACSDHVIRNNDPFWLLRTVSADHLPQRYRCSFCLFRAFVRRVQSQQPKSILKLIASVAGRRLRVHRTVKLWQGSA